MFLLVLPHPGCPGQNPESRKTVVCVCVCVCAHAMDKSDEGSNLIVYLSLLSFFRWYISARHHKICTLVSQS